MIVLNFSKIDIAQLCTGVSAGNREAIEEFYQLTFTTLYQNALFFSGRDEHFCLDIVQDSILKILRKIPQLSSQEKLECWLRVVVKSVVYDAFRKEQRQRKKELNAQPLNGQTEEDSADLDREARLLWIESQLLNLNAKEAELITMRYRFGWTLERIGKTLGVKPGAVDGRVQRLTKKLQQQAREVFHE